MSSKRLEDILNENLTDALKEVGNIGAGHGAIALTNFLNREIDMTIPYIRIIDRSQFAKYLSPRGFDEKEPLASVFLKFVEDPHLMTSGEVESNEEDFAQVFACFDNKSIKTLIGTVTTKKLQEQEEQFISLDSLDSLHQSLIKEVGNIILLHYVSAINEFIKGSSYMPNADPVLFFGNATEITSFILTEFKKHVSDVNKIKILSVQVGIHSKEEYGDAVRCNLFLAMHENAIQLLARKLEAML